MNKILLVTGSPAEVNSLFRGYGIHMTWMDTNRFASSNPATIKEAKHLLHANNIEFSITNTK